MRLTQQDKLNIAKVIYDQPTAQRVIELLDLAGADTDVSGNAQYSQVQEDPANSSALGVGATVMGTAGTGNGSNSLVSGANSRTGNPSRYFTCVAGSTTITYTGIDVSSEYYVATGDIPNIIIGFIDSEGNPSAAHRLVTSVVFSGGDTTIVLNNSINDYTADGYSVDPYYGSFAFSQGLNCIAKGVGGVASGYNATANGFLSRADGANVTAEKRLSRAYGIAAISEDFNEETYGAPYIHQASDNIDRVLRFSGLCQNGSALTLTLDYNTTGDPGTETMTIPDNSVCNCMLYLTAFQSDALLANHGDCVSALYGFGLKKMSNVITVVGGGGIVPIYYFQDGAGGWSVNFDITGAELSLEFTGQNGVKVRGRLEIDQITQF